MEFLVQFFNWVLFEVFVFSWETFAAFSLMFLAFIIFGRIIFTRW